MSFVHNIDLLKEVAEESLSLWALPKDVSLSLLNVSENTTWLVKGNQYKSILRLHRQGYQANIAINSELQWIDALRNEKIILTPKAILGRNGAILQKHKFNKSGSSFFLVMFEFIEGKHIDENYDLAPHFIKLGNIAALLHTQAKRWILPSGFSRLSWNETTVFGDNPIWGNWRMAPNIDSAILSILEKAEKLVCEKLHYFGKTKDRYGLLHADMRLANLLIKDSDTWVIDFDDCGFGWFLYDFAASVSFIEDSPQIPNCKNAWIRGYNQIRFLSSLEERMLDVFVMFRRFALLAWIGSHKEAPEAQALATDFASISAKLAEKFLQEKA